MNSNIRQVATASIPNLMRKYAGIPSHWVKSHSQYAMGRDENQYRIDCMEQTFFFNVPAWLPEGRQREEFGKSLLKVIMTLWGEPQVEMRS